MSPQNHQLFQNKLWFLTHRSFILLKRIEFWLLELVLISFNGRHWRLKIKCLDIFLNTTDSNCIRKKCVWRHFFWSIIEVFCLSYLVSMMFAVILMFVFCSCEIIVCNREYIVGLFVFYLNFVNGSEMCMI